jgi:hypothetical protein
LDRDGRELRRIGLGDLGTAGESELVKSHFGSGRKETEGIILSDREVKVVLGPRHPFEGRDRELEHGGSLGREPRDFEGPSLDGCTVFQDTPLQP